LPVIPLLSIGAGLCLSRVRWRVMVVLLGALLASVPLYASLQEWRKLASEKPLAYWSGQSDRVEWLMEIGYNGMIQFPSVIRQINTWIDEGAIPRDATLFMLGESKGNLLQCRHLPDGSRYGQRWVSEILRTGGDYDELARDFEERGIRYFVWNDGYLGWSVLNTSVRPEEVAFSLYHFGQFLQRHIEQVRRIPGMGLGKLKQDRPSDGQG